MQNNKKTYIAVFDSGIGGISILRQLILKHKCGNYIYFADNKYMPYGTKNKQFVKERVTEIVNYLNKHYNISKIIIACNTASSCLCDIKLNKVELLTFNNLDTYLTTELTHKNLTNINTISANNLASLIEKHVNNKLLMSVIIKCVVHKLKLCKLDSLTLGCTHYELAESYFKKYCKNTKIKLNSTDVINLIPPPQTADLTLKIILSNNIKSYKNKILKLLNF